MKDEEKSNVIGIGVNKGRGTEQKSASGVYDDKLRLVTELHDLSYAVRRLVSHNEFLSDRITEQERRILSLERHVLHLARVLEIEKKKGV